MAITEAFAGTEAIAGTQWSCPRDASYSSASPQTDDGIYQVFLDVSDMIAADLLLVRVYEKVGAASTQRLVYEATLKDVQNEPVFVLPSLILLHGWDVTLQASSGTITVDWSIRKIA